MFKDKRKISRRAFLCDLAILSSMALVGCATPTPTPSPTQAPAKPTDVPQPTAEPLPTPTPAPKIAGLVRSVWWTAQVENGLKAAADEWVKMNPEAKAEVEIRPWEGFEDWLLTQLVAGTAPEVCQSHGWVEHYSRDLAIRFNEYLEQPSPYSDSKRWMDDFMGGLIERYGSPNSDYCMVPLDSVDSGIYYNKTIFDKLGLKPPKTFTEWFAVCEELKKAGYNPIGIDGNKPNFSFFHWGLRIVGDRLQAHKFPKLNLRPYRESWPVDRLMTDPTATAGEMLDGEEIVLGFRSGLLDPTQSPEFAYAYEAFAELAGKYGQPGWQSTEGKSNVQSFLQQGIAMIFSQTTQLKPWQKDIASMPKEQQFEFSTFLYPTFDKPFSKEIPVPEWGSRSVGGIGVKIGVPKPKNADVEAAAINFVQWLTSPKGNQMVMDNGDPIGPAVIKGVVVAGFEAWAQAPGFAVCGAIAETLYQDGEGVNAWKDLCYSYFSGKMDVQTLAAQVKEVATQAHERAIESFKWDLDLKTTE